MRHKLLLVNTIENLGASSAKWGGNLFSSASSSSSSASRSQQLLEVRPQYQMFLSCSVCLLKWASNCANCLHILISVWPDFNHFKHFDHCWSHLIANFKLDTFWFSIRGFLGDVFCFSLMSVALSRRAPLSQLSITEINIKGKLSKTFHFLGLCP